MSHRRVPESQWGAGVAGGPISRRAMLLGGIAGLATAQELFAQAGGKQPVDAGAAVSVQADPRIGEIVADVSQDQLRETLESLMVFPTRWSESQGFGEVEDWMARAFEARDPASGQNATRQGYVMPSGNARNNILWGDPMSGRPVILIGAHLDTISELPKLSAPGANDNGSGIVAMLEAQRVLAAHSFDHEIVFVAFTGEEQDLLGSRACAERAAQDGWPIALMVNLDMVGLRPPTPDFPLVIEYDQGNVRPSNDAPARAYGEAAADLAAAHTTLVTSHTDIWDSDYMPFEAEGFTCIGFYDGGADSDEYHTTGDVIELVDFARLEQVTRLLVATVSAAAGLQ